MLENIPAAVGHALASVRAGFDKIAFAQVDAPVTLSITSDAFSDGAAIPSRYTADGAKVSPPLRFTAIPPSAKSLVLIVEDADSPTPTPLCHALAWGIVGEDGGFQEAALDPDATPPARCGAVFGKNSFLNVGWLAPDPPTGHGPHRYAFQLYALDTLLDLEPGSGRSALVAALKGRVLAKGLLVGSYERAA
jgi:Raf kinase inhibitor-like YbhB/YbcL family protein